LRGTKRLKFNDRDERKRGGWRGGVKGGGGRRDTGRSRRSKRMDGDGRRNRVGGKVRGKRM